MVDRYPHCLRLLELIQDSEFRKALSQPLFIQMLYDQQFYHWKYYRSVRLRMDLNEQ